MQNMARFIHHRRCHCLSSHDGQPIEIPVMFVTRVSPSPPNAQAVSTRILLERESTRMSMCSVDQVFYNSLARSTTAVADDVPDAVPVTKTSLVLDAYSDVRGRVSPPPGSRQAILVLPVRWGTRFSNCWGQQPEEYRKVWCIQPPRSPAMASYFEL